jgi:hypothetical protein
LLLLMEDHAALLFKLFQHMAVLIIVEV